MAIRRRSSRSYDLNTSPFFRLERKRDLAKLLGISLSELSRLVREREQYYIFRSELIGTKIRDLAIPVRSLRRCHDRLLTLLRRIRLPDHIRCPKKGSSPIQNALTHVGQGSITTADIKDFYPSTTEEHVFRFFRYKMEMSDDCARILARLCTVRNGLPVGSPVSPHLASLTHLDIFDDAADLANRIGNQLTVWVDDVSYSGKTHRRDLISAIRRSATSKGFGVHKLQRGGRGRTVEITGTALRKGRADVANASNLKLKDVLDEFRSQSDPVAKLLAGNKALGILRHHRQLRRLAGRRTEGEEARIRWIRREIEAVVVELNSRPQLTTNVALLPDVQDSPF